MFIRNKQESKIQVAPKIRAYKFPLSNSVVFQTTKSVKAPKSAGKNFTQKTELPSKKMR
jgi:hypothetical protein